MTQSKLTERFESWGLKMKRGLIALTHSACTTSFATVAALLALSTASDAHAFTVSDVTILQLGSVTSTSTIGNASDGWGPTLPGGELYSENCADGSGNTSPCPLSNDGPNFDGFANSTANLVAPIAGSYTNYQATGSLSGSIAGSISSQSFGFVDSNQNLDFTIDQAVNFIFTATFDTGSGCGSGSFSSVGISSNFMTDVSFACGLGTPLLSASNVLLNNSGVLLAGTYSFAMGLSLEAPSEFGFTEGNGTASFILTLSAVPVPAAVWMFSSALGLLGWMSRKSA